MFKLFPLPTNSLFKTFELRNLKDNQNRELKINQDVNIHQTLHVFDMDHLIKYLKFSTAYIIMQMLPNFQKCFL